MSQGGKFSQPRPHRDEERQIEQAFRQVTGQAPARKRSPLEEEIQMEQAFAASHPQTPTQKIPSLDEEAQIERAFQQVTGQQPAPQAKRPAPRTKAQEFDLLPENMDVFFENGTPAPEEEPEESQPDFIDNLLGYWNKAVDFCGKNQKVVMVGLCAVALLLIACFIGIFFASTADPYDGKILDNVIIADINVGGMTKNEAISAVKQATSHTYGSADMVIHLSGTEIRLSPEDTGVTLDVKAVVSEAFDYGRTGTQSEREKALEASRTQEHIIGLLPYLDLEEDYIREVLTSYAEDTGSTLTQPSYGLEGEEPELSADKFDENAPCQTLVITMGTPGIGFDVNDVYNQVLDAYSLHVFLVTVEDIESVKDPDPVDLEAIYEEFYIAPVNATVNMQNFKTEPGSYGYGFDLPEAQKLIDKAEYGEVVRIPMEYIAPEILDADAFFRDTLGVGQTRTTGNDNRNTNLRLACEAIDGTVLNPGETLSFNSSISSVSGYKSAPEDTGRDAVNQGGVSQVASTLYYAALMSDLDIVSRTNHSYVPSFIDHGLDATANLKIRNSTGFPIRIDAQVSGGYVKVEIVGTEERDYYIMLDSSISSTYEPSIEYADFIFDNSQGYKDGDVIEEGLTGYLVKSYKVKYDNQTGKELSRDFIINSQYPAQNRIVARVEPEPTTVPTTEATEPPTETTQPPETTVPPTTQATEPSTAPTTEPTTAPTTAPTTVPTTEPVTPSTESPQVPADSDGTGAAEDSGSQE